MLGQTSNSSPLPAAVTVLPGAVDPQKSLIATASASIPAGGNATAYVTIADAFGNAVLPDDAAATMIVSSVAVKGGDAIPAVASFNAESGSHEVTVRLYAAGAYDLQVDC